MIPIDLLLGVAALILLIFPGWLMARARGLPLPTLAGFIFGAVGLLLVIQLLEAFDLGLSAKTIFPAWLAVVLGAILVSRHPTAKSVPTGSVWRVDWPLMLPVLPAVGVVAYRAITQPLYGIDTIFRWNFLAEQMLGRGTLAFYPPVSAVDYAIYAWPDGIAPVVSSLYFWAYVLPGAARPVLTAPIVIFQFLLVLVTAYALARRLASTRAAAIACALVAGSPIVLWSTAMGQESGLMTIALLALLFYLPASREAADIPATIAAGLAASLGGLAREYGLAFILLGLGLGLIRRLSARTLVIFLLTAALGTIPWYGRNWLHSGNPFFNLDVAGIFPVNIAHLKLMKTYQSTYGWKNLSAESLQIFIPNCMAALAGGVGGFLVGQRAARPFLAAIILTLILWATALGYTAAGFTYSLRVLAPALVIAAVLGGVTFARFVPNQKYTSGLSIALFVFALDAMLRTLGLPANIYKIPPAAWLSMGGGIHAYHQRPVYRQLSDYVAGRRILVLGPTALLTNQGASTVPLWSPEVSFLWDKSISASKSVELLSERGIAFALLNKGAVNQAYLDQIPFFSRNEAASLQAIWSDNDMTLFKVNAISSTAP